MEFVQGISLRQYLESRNQTMSFTEAWNFLLPVMEALEKVHQNKLIHRDISPDNFIIKEDGSIKLLDFGSAREYAEEKTMTVLVKKDMRRQSSIAEKENRVHGQIYILSVQHFMR